MQMDRLKLEQFIEVYFYQGIQPSQNLNSQ